MHRIDGPAGERSGMGAHAQQWPRRSHLPPSPFPPSRHALPPAPTPGLAFAIMHHGIVYCIHVDQAPSHTRQPTLIWLSGAQRALRSI